MMLLQLASKQGNATPPLLHAAKGLLSAIRAAYTNSAAASSAALEALDAASSSASSLAVSMHGPTAVLELNRPKQMNALSTQVLQVCSMNQARVCVCTFTARGLHTHSGHA